MNPWNSPCETSGTKNSRPCGALISSALRRGFRTAAWNSPPICSAPARLPWWRTGPKSARLARWVGPSSQGRPAAMPVGFIVAETGSRGTGHIITIDVLPSARGAGVGSQLLRAAEERLRALHCQSVILETAVDNKPALVFLQTASLHRNQDPAALLFERRRRLRAKERFAFAAGAS